MIAHVVALLLSASPAPDAGASTATALKHPISVLADTLKIVNKKNLAYWNGHVKARRGTTDIACDRAIAYYAEQDEIRRIECRGHVVILDGNRRVIGGAGDFDNVTGVIDVTILPEAWQGKNHMAGDRITFNVTDDIIEVEHPKADFETTQTNPAHDRPKKKSHADAGVAAP